MRLQDGIGYNLGMSLIERRISWLIVGSSVVSVVKKVFLERKVSDYLNKTHIEIGRAHV